MISVLSTFSSGRMLRNSSLSISENQGSGLNPRSMGIMDLVVYPTRECNKRPMTMSESCFMSFQSAKRKFCTRSSNSCILANITCPSASAVRASGYVLKDFLRRRFWSSRYSMILSSPPVIMCSSTRRMNSPSFVCLKNPIETMFRTSSSCNSDSIWP